MVNENTGQADVMIFNVMGKTCRPDKSPISKVVPPHFLMWNPAMEPAPTAAVPFMQTLAGLKEAQDFLF